MGKTFEVLVSTTSLHRSQLGSITGLIAVRAGDIAFPDDNWSDFPVVILGWWMDHCRRIRSGGTARCSFMDGPYKFEIHVTPGARLAEIELPVPDSSTVHIEFDEVMAEIYRAARTVLAGCDANGWKGSDRNVAFQTADSGVIQLPQTFVGHVG